MKYHEIKAEKSKKLDALITECSLFFAFSNKQFEENKTPLQDGEKYVSIGAGGYMPKSKAQQFKDGLDSLDKWEKQEIKKHKQQNEQIKHELYNHECFYTGDISPVCEILPNIDRGRILKVYQSERITANQTI